MISIVVVVLLVLVGLAEIAALDEAPVNLATAGFSTNQVNPCWALPVYVSEKGTLRASWTSFPPTSSAFFESARYHAGAANCTLAKWGDPLWIGAQSAANDSFALHVSTGEYDLVFIGSPNGSDVHGNMLMLTPDPPAWWPWG